MLDVALRGDVFAVSFKDVVWRLLEALLDDPDPTPAHEERYGGSNMDPSTMALNTVRGKTAHAVISYMLWLRRDADRCEAESAGFDSMPEVRSTLERLLDPAQEPSTTVRAVVARWWPWLVMMDEQWAIGAVDRVFPVDDSTMFDAAWAAYVTPNTAYDRVYELTSAKYMHAIARLPEYQRADRDHPEDLARHLMTLYWRGIIELGSPDGLLKWFFETADDKTRAYAVTAIGRGLHRDDTTLDDDSEPRLRALWEARLDAARERAEDKLAELASFGWWFSSGKLDADWALDQLIAAMSLHPRSEPEHAVLDQIDAVFDGREGRAIEALSLLLQPGRGAERKSLWRERISAILRRGLRHPATDGTTRRLVDELLAEGHLQFRSVIESDAE